MFNENRIAMYIRLSNDDDDIGGKKIESNSISAQRNLIISYIKNNKELSELPIEEYVDDGYTGTNFDRPSFTNMMMDARKGKLSVIIVKDLSRFGRDHLGVGDYLERILPVLQVRMIAINDNYDSGLLDGVTGGMNVALHNLINAMYSKDASVKIKTAYDVKARKGLFLNSIPPFGYIRDPEDSHHLIIDEEAAKIVRIVFERVASGEARTETLSFLNGNHIITPSEYMVSKGRLTNIDRYNMKKIWQSNMIRNMIVKEVYIGNMVRNKMRKEKFGSKKMVLTDPDDWIRVENTHEPIVSKELFELANSVIKKKRLYKGEKKEPVVKSSLFICPYCSRALAKNHKSYTCRFATSSGIDECKSVHPDKEKLERAVVELIGKMAELVDKEKSNGEMADAKSSRYISDMVERMVHKGYSSDIATIMDVKDIKKAIADGEVELTKIKAKKMETYDDYRSGAFDKNEYCIRFEKLSEQTEQQKSKIAILEDTLKKIEERQNELEEKSTMLHTAENGMVFDKGLVLSVIDKIKVYDTEHIEVIWKFDDFNQI